MSRHAWTGAALALLVAAPLAHAQNQSSSAAPSSGESITVQGCLQKPASSGSLAGTPLGTSATPANAGDVANLDEPPPGFILAGAREIDTPVGTSGAGAEGAAKSASSQAGADAARNDAARSDAAANAALKTFALIADEDAIAQYRGQRVEIVGTLAPPVGSDAAKPADRVGGRTAADARGSARPQADAGDGSFQTGVPQLRVHSVKAIAEDCTER